MERVLVNRMCLWLDREYEVGLDASPRPDGVPVAKIEVFSDTHVAVTWEDGFGESFHNVPFIVYTDPPEPTP